MAHRPINHLRVHRKLWALSTKDVARLVDQRSGTAISKFEGGKRLPTLRVALALHFLFGLPPREMFPGAYQAIEDAVVKRLARLSIRLEGKTDPKSKANREFLEWVGGRHDANQAET
jgi:transcriptional regulator with XRE-family HTH domain